MYVAVETKDDYYNALGAKIKGASFYLCEEESDINKLPVKVGNDFFPRST